MSRTYVIMEVSESTYDEILGKLREANYDHAIHEDVLDMDGIALKKTSNADRPLCRSVVDNDQQRDEDKEK